MPEGLRDLLVTYLPVLLTLLVLNLIVYLWRRQSRQALIERVAELEGLSNAGSALVAAQLNLDNLCDLVVKETDKIIDTRTLQIGFFKGDLYEIRSWMIEGVPQQQRIINIKDRPGLVGWVRESKQPLLVRDLEKELDSLPSRPRYVTDTPPRAALFIPLISGSHVLGVLAAHSKRPNHFNSKHVRQLTIVANQAAAAIANARLFESESRRARQIELIGQVTHHINAMVDIEEAFNEVVRRTRDAFDYFHVNIFSIEHESGQIILEASSASDFPLHVPYLPVGEGIVGGVAASGATAVVHDVADEPKALTTLGIPEVDAIWSQTQSEIATPLLVDNQVWGVLEIVSREVEAFDQDDKEVVETLASGVAIAIQKAQQLALQREQAWYTSTRLQVASAINESEGMEEVYDRVARLVVLLFGFEAATFWEWDAHLERYLGMAAFSLSGQANGVVFDRNMQLEDWGALAAAHLGAEDIETLTRPPWETPTAVGSHHLFPLLLNHEVVGMLVVAQKEPEDPSRRQERRNELLRDISEQTVRALERTRLRLAQQEEAWINTALLQVADAVNSLIDLNQILSTIVRFVPLLIGVRNCVVLFWDEDDGLYRVGPSYGIDPMGLGLIQTLELDDEELGNLLQQPIPNQLQSTSQVNPIIFNLNLQPWMQRVLGTSSARALPLRAQGRHVGAMVIGLESAGPELTAKQLSILTGIGQQAATAVVNNQLYAEAAERDRLEQELNVARQIQSSLIPSERPQIPWLDVASYWTAARQVSGDFYDFIELESGQWVLLIADVADKGVPAALFMAVSRTILRAVADTRNDPAQILTRANQLILSSTDTDLFVTVFLGIWNGETRQLRFANGGHNPPLVFNGRSRPLELKTPGMALGVIPEASYQTGSITLEENDVLILYTDGVTEAVNEGLDEFGLTRLEVVIRSNIKASSDQILDSIRQAVSFHVGTAAQFDDMTMVVARCCPTA